EHPRTKLHFHYTPIFYQLLQSLRQMPLPPYIKQHLHHRQPYQTLYSKHLPSPPPPTPPLHFTNHLLHPLKQ
ncbi:S-adenosylmethionine:tRNA ribosyltransferase-isomerase, partial [Bacillus pumilus]|uniref:S-adenosylmethionine:tRNA ribosyltransferase-isomerase n=1 Tax=Bacillus pumilus TaxID=1408 RepID=UPI001642884A